MAQHVYKSIRNYYSSFLYIIGKTVIFQRLYVLEINIYTFTDEMTGCLGFVSKLSVEGKGEREREKQDGPQADNYGSW